MPLLNINSVNSTKLFDVNKEFQRILIRQKFAGLNQLQDSGETLTKQVDLPNENSVMSHKAWSSQFQKSGLLMYKKAN